MKPKECAKYVFQPYSCKLYRLKNDGRTLYECFPELSCFHSDSIIKVFFILKGNQAMAWRDKHGNIIVRIHHADTQTKLF